MIVSSFLLLAIALGSLTETPFIAYDLATNMCHCDRIEWTKMRDDDNNVKFVITFHNISIKSELGFQKALSKHRCCQSCLKKDLKTNEIKR